MSDQSNTTTFWSPDCPIAQAAKAQQAQLDWITYSWAEIAPSVADICTEIASGQR